MPLKMGNSHQVLKENIQELMKSGKSQKESIATALSMKRRSKKKMAEGGIVDEPGYNEESLDLSNASHEMREAPMSDLDENAERGLGELNDLGAEREDYVESPQFQKSERLLAKRLFAQAAREPYAEGGLVIGKKQLPTGSHPELDWIDDGTAEPMSSLPKKPGGLEHAEIEGVPQVGGLSSDALKALEEKRKKRRHMI